MPTEKCDDFHSVTGQMFEKLGIQEYGTITGIQLVLVLCDIVTRLEKIESQLAARAPHLPMESIDGA
jgi:hypothetical protein